ncbi:MAG: hypothetical protein COA44_10240 [Arcobacter sp.]|nr:MAG: hypothetical protein COA44_10240 [Arcobacter sp.]
MRYFLLFISVLSLLHANKLSIQTLEKETRVAYIISNGDYDDSPLPVAIENGRKMKTFLENHDFEVIYKEDASKRDIIKGLRQFKASLKPNGIALFYFAGHMIQVKERNYLIPIEASIESDYHVLYEAINLEAITSKMDKMNSRLNIIIIDSSYANPFGDRFRARKLGIAPIDSDKNTDIILSTKPNKTVKPYPFTTKVLAMLSLNGLSNNEGFKTFKKRYPQSFIHLSSQDFYFNIPNKLEDKEEKLWMKTLKLGSLTAYAHYLSTYANGKHTKQAKLDTQVLTRKADETLKKQKELEEKSNKNDEAKKELERLKQEEEKKRLKEEAQETKLLEIQKEKEEALLTAALVEEKRISRENARFIEPVMVLIKAGSFMMGSDHDNEDEAPSHMVNIENDFYIGRFEVTNIEYKEYLRISKQKRMLPPNWTTDTQPVVGITWDDATAYAAWLSDVTAKVYRLPTEEEWEYAAKAGSSTRYYWGDEDASTIKKSFWRSQYPENAHDYAWIKTNSNSLTHDVGEKIPNAWGLHDVTGNVWEWCANSYSDNYSLEPEEELLKVIRGGSWFSTPEEITLSHRGANVNDFTSYNIGFRLLREK